MLRSSSMPPALQSLLQRVLETDDALGRSLPPALAADGRASLLRRTREVLDAWRAGDLGDGDAAAAIEAILRELAAQ